MGLQGSGPDPWQAPGLNQAVYALAKYRGEIYAGGLFDDTGGGGNNEADCSDDSDYPLQCIAKWNPSTNAWTSVGVGLNNQVDALLVKDDTLYVGGSFDDVMGGPGIGVCNPAPGLRWSSNTTGTVNNDWQSVAWGGPAAGSKQFVAVASSGLGNRVMTSPDGVTWTSQTTPTNNEWRSVTWGYGTFVAVASSGSGDRVMTSPDGVTWTSRTSAADNEWQSVTWGNDKFVAVASAGPGKRVMTSNNGITWSGRTASKYDNDWKSVTWAGNMFVAVSSSGTGQQVMVSPNGVAWSTRTTGTEARQWQSVARGDTGEPDKASDDIIVAVASSGADKRVMTSVVAPSPGDLRCIAAWNGTSWAPVGGGLDGGVTSLAPLGEDAILAAGGFEFADPPAQPYASLPGLVTWSDDGWTHPGVGGFDALAFALLTDGSDTAFVGGEFDGDYPANDDLGIIQMSGSYDAPESWSSMSTGFSWINENSETIPGRVDALALLNGTVFAGGYFTATGDRSRPLHNIASWNGSSWNTVGAGLNTDDQESRGSSSVLALQADDTRGLLYIGGTFDDTFGGAGTGKCDEVLMPPGPLRCITVWDSGINQFIPFKWGSDEENNGLTGEVQSIVVDDSSVYVGGRFNTWPEGGFPREWNLKNVGKWTWSPPTGSVTASASSGETVAITGTRFIGVPSDGVKFGSTAVPFTRSSTESISATVPSSLASGTYTISVNGVGGWANVGTVVVTQTSGGGDDPTPTPTPTPAKKETQKLLTPVSLPKSITPNRWVTLVDRTIMTSANEKVRVRVRSAPVSQSLTSTGDVRPIKVKRTPKGKVSVKVQSPPTRVIVTLSAPGTSEFKPYRSTKAYTVR